jgi:uncharacterized protein (DUF1697 family)
VIRKPVAQARLREEFARRLPFASRIVVCRGQELVRLVSHEAFADYPERPDQVRFVSVLSGPVRTAPPLPLILPSSGTWLLRVLAREGRFVVGVYRRDMKVIGCLGKLDTMFGVPVTTRSWNTITAIAKVLDDRGTRT